MSSAIAAFCAYLDASMRNWRWWVLLPFSPFLLAVCLMASALATAEDEIMKLMAWMRRGDRA